MIKRHGLCGVCRLVDWSSRQVSGIVHSCLNWRPRGVDAGSGCLLFARFAELSRKVRGTLPAALLRHRKQPVMEERCAS